MGSDLLAQVVIMYVFGIMFTAPWKTALVCLGSTGCVGGLQRRAAWLVSIVCVYYFFHIFYLNQLRWLNARCSRGIVIINSTHNSPTISATSTSPCTPCSGVSQVGVGSATVSNHYFQGALRLRSASLARIGLLMMAMN